MKSIRMNNEHRETILNLIRLHINEKYEKSVVYLEIQEQKNTFTKQIEQAIHSLYNQDLSILKKWKLGAKIKSFYLKYKGENDFDFNYSAPFTKRGWIYFEFSKNIFIPLAFDPDYTSNWNSKHTIKNIIQNNPHIFSLFALIHQMDCDIETEKTKLLKAYESILYEFRTTKTLLDKHPSMKQFMDCVWKNELINPTESEQIIKKFETEIID